MSSEGDQIIRVRRLSKTYRIYGNPIDRLKQLMLGQSGRRYYSPVPALSDVSFDVARGEAVGIVGRNGSGKSTLLQIICGTVGPSSGSVDIEGRVAPLLELGSGFNPEFTGLENLYLSAAVLGLSRQETDARVEQITEFASIGEFIGRPVKTYSSGMYARLAFAVAVHVDPDVLVVDEALSVGDLAFQQKCIKRMFELREQKVTLLFVSHDPYQVKTVCNRAVYLRDGMLVRFGDAGEVVDAYLADLHTKAADTDTAEIDVSVSLHPYEISRVRLRDAAGGETRSIRTGETVQLSIDFERLLADADAPISFVFNLYRADGLYICGTTTLMDGMKPFAAAPKGRVTVTFPTLPLLAGRYHWRVAINDEHGLSVLAKMDGVCPFVVEDGFKSVGIVDIERRWDLEASSATS